MRGRYGDASAQISCWRLSHDSHRAPVTVEGQQPPNYCDDPLYLPFAESGTDRACESVAGASRGFGYLKEASAFFTPTAPSPAPTIVKLLTRNDFPDPAQNMLFGGGSSPKPFNEDNMKLSLKRLTSAVLLAAGLTSGAHAGSIFLTGHDVDFHGGQNGFDTVILDYLRGGGTPIAASSYRVGMIRSAEIGGGVGGVLAGSWAGGVTFADPSTFTAATFATFLGTIDVLVVASHTSCGGCDLSTADSNALNAFAPQIASFFNAGGDIWGNTGATLSTYYNFLPSSAAASGSAISGSSGFTCTAAGVAIGINCSAGGTSHINGHQTHNRFSAFDSDFTVFEIRGDEVVSIGIRDAVITDGGIDPGPGPGGVPEPGSLALVGLGALGLAWSRRRSAAR